MTSKRYYSARTGRNPVGTQLDLPMFLRLFKDLYNAFKAKDFFQEAFGYRCVDEGEVAGTLGSDIAAQMRRSLRKTNLWPVQNTCLNYSEDDLFDVIELLYDNVSMPLEGNFHDWNNCGWHYYKFDRASGREEYRTAINELLVDYKGGYELSLDGEILALPENGMDNLLQANLPVYDPENVERRVANAILKFRRYSSSDADRRDAIRDLADVLEFLRPKLKSVLTKADEADLFNIANNFGIRHHNDAQKTGYEKAIWYSWMFYSYLAAIHASIRLMQRNSIPPTT